MKPVISIITVVNNSAATIADTLLSVRSQTYPHIEHVIIDGASTDDTLKIIRERTSPNVVIKSEPDRGMYDAMNKGLAMATGDVIGFLNADDVYADSHVLENVAGVIEAQNVDACYGDLVYVDKSDTRKVVRYWKSQPYRDGLFEKGWMPAHPTFFVKRQVYEKWGGFDLEYKRQSDFELAMRFLAVHKIKSVYIPRVLVRMRSGGASSRFAHILAGNIESYRACRKHSLDVGPLFIPRKILSRIPQILLRNKHKDKSPAKG